MRTDAAADPGKGAAQTAPVAKGWGNMKTMRRWGVAAILLAGVAGGPALREARSAAPLSSAAAQALREPPEQMSPALQRELESLWAERATRFLRALLLQPGDEIVTQLWIDHLAGKPYLHFKAIGQNAGYTSDPRLNVVVVLFIGPAREDLDREFGDWFAPYEGNGQFIRPVEFGAERSAISNITDDGTQNIYWQQDRAFVEVRSRGDVLDLAQRVHAEAIRLGIYTFPRAWEPPDQPQTESVSLEPRSETSAPAGEGAAPSPVPVSNSGPEASPTPLAPPVGVSAPAVQPSQEELAGGWERIEASPSPVEATGAQEVSPPAPAESTTPANPAATPAPAASPRIPASTLGLAIHAAVRRNEASPVAALIRAGADLEAHDSEGRTPLMTAAETASPEIIRELIAAGAHVDAVPDGLGVAAHDQGMTPLMLAARAGRTDAVVALVEGGASLTARSVEGMTALQLAETAGHEETVRVLRAAAGEPLPAPEAETPPATPAGQPPAADAAAEAALPVVRDVPAEPGLTERALESLQPSGGSTLVVTSIGEVRLWQARLESAWKHMNVDINQDTDATVLRALILDWDARVRPDSTGATAYEAWRAALAALHPANPAVAAEPSPDLTDAQVVQALRDAAASLRQAFGQVEVPYSRKNP